MFGTRKIYEKVQGNTPCISVGTEWMPSGEFIEQYGREELSKWKTANKKMSLKRIK